MKSQIIKNALVVNEGVIEAADVRIKGPFIDRIDADISVRDNDKVIDANGAWLLPGMIDDQVHFREPGLTHKGSIASESKAAVVGGITSYMEMPNVDPATTNAAALNAKFAIAERDSWANFSFYLGATEDNLDEIKRADPSRICGLKVFMGASTGNLLVEDHHALENIFRESPLLIVTHCESGKIIKHNQSAYLQRHQYADIHAHPIIRNDEACYASSAYAVSLAKKYQSQLHVLHITTAKELSLFGSGNIRNKHITAEACVHHLWFTDKDYSRLGNQIKCNPAIKSTSDRDALLAALNDGRLDIIATDHAPHTWSEKQVSYPQAPAGLPLVQHALPSLLDHVHCGRLSIEKVVEKTAHNPAIRYRVAQRGFIKEGYYADLVLASPKAVTRVSHDQCLYHCGWTPFDGVTFNGRILSTWVNGVRCFDGEQITRSLPNAMPLVFDR